MTPATTGLNVPSVLRYISVTVVGAAHVASVVAVVVTPVTVQSNGRCGPENSGPVVGWSTTARVAVELPDFAVITLGPFGNPWTSQSPWPNVVACSGFPARVKCGSFTTGRSRTRRSPPVTYCAFVESAVIVSFGVAACAVAPSVRVAATMPTTTRRTRGLRTSREASGGCGSWRSAVAEPDVLALMVPRR